MAREELFTGVEAFTQVARAASFRAAADELGVSTAAVSQAVKRLEERVGVKLFARTSRRVVLTPEGARYEERCREAIRLMQSARAELAQARRQPSGELRVSASLLLGPVIVPELARLVAQYPKLSLRVTLNDRVTRLLEENIDVAVRVGARTDSTLVSRRLLAPRWVTVASPSFMARSGTPSTPSDLEHYNCLRFVAPNGKPRHFSFRGPRPGQVQLLPVSGNLVLDHGWHLLDAARAGQGIVQVLDFMARRPLALGELIEVLPTYATDGPGVFAVMAPERQRSPNVRAFVDLLGEVFERVQRE
jgi:LysR family transcriptional regulator for bpeEF and oprC